MTPPRRVGFKLGEVELAAGILVPIYVLDLYPAQRLGAPDAVGDLSIRIGDESLGVVIRKIEVCASPNRIWLRFPYHRHRRSKSGSTGFCLVFLESEPFRKMLQDYAVQAVTQWAREMRAIVGHPLAAFAPEFAVVYGTRMSEATGKIEVPGLPGTAEKAPEGEGGG